MTAQQLKIEQTTLEADLKARIGRFEKKTGTIVAAIDIERQEIYLPDGKQNFTRRHSSTITRLKSNVTL